MVELARLDAHHKTRNIKNYILRIILRMVYLFFDFLYTLSASAGSQIIS